MRVAAANNEPVWLPQDTSEAAFRASIRCSCAVGNSSLWPFIAVARYAWAMTTASDDQLAKLSAAFDTFARRYKLADVLGSEMPLNELDKLTLLYVRDHPACGPTDVARYLGVANTTLSSATDRLVKRGLLERHRLEADRRAVGLRLSEKGAARAEAYARAHHAMAEQMLQALTTTERDSFIRLILKIVHDDP